MGKVWTCFLVWRILWRKTVSKQVTLELISVSKITWLIWSAGFLSISRAVSNKYKWITDPFHVDSPQNFDFSLEEEEEEETYVDSTCDTYFKVQFSRKSHTEFWVGTGGEFPHLSGKALNILPPFATSYLCETVQ
jgi:hypothetical protein